MKRLIALAGIVCLLLSGCGSRESQSRVAATTLPVYEFTLRLCEGTGITVTRLVTESVSCLHDYSLNVRQVRATEAAEIVVISGAGLEEFLHDLAVPGTVIDAAAGIELLCGDEGDHDHGHEEQHHDGHSHENDPHIWLSPENAAVMAENICTGLSRQYPQHAETFQRNLDSLLADIAAVEAYGREQLGSLACREMITFHDGFSYFADAFGLTILEAVEEESGSEASARELKALIGLVRAHNLPAVLIEINGSCSAAEVIARETGAAVFSLDMAMGGESWFDAMYHNIDTIKEALG